VRTGDEVELFPAASACAYAGCNPAGKMLTAPPGASTAGDLRESITAALKRGMVLAAPGKFRKTREWMSVWSCCLSAKMKQRSRVHFHAGTAETIARFIFTAKKNWNLARAHSQT